MNTNTQKRCRVCTSRNTQMMSIFEQYNFSERNLQVFEVITKCAVVQIRKLDGFSEQICNKCLKHLSQAFSFKQLCEDSDYKFRHNLIIEERIVLQDAHCDKETNIQHCDNNENNIKEEVDCISSDVIFEIKNESSEGETRNQDGIAENQLHNENVRRISTDLKEFFAEDTKIFYGNSQLQNENVTNSSTRELQNGINELSGNLPQTIATTFQENRQICDTNLIFPQNRAKIHVNEVNNGILNISVDISSNEESGIDAEEIENEHDFSNEQLPEENIRKTSTNTFPDLQLQSTIMPNENSQMSGKGKNLEKENSHICTYFNRIILNNHRGINKERYKCKVCGKYYKCKPALIRLGRLHFRGTTNNESPNYNSDMNDHTASFKCETCCKIFTQRCNLSRHKKIHTGEKPFKCEICDKSFIQKITLKKHLRIHTGEKPFKCETCSQSFSWKITLNCHLKIHTGEKPFKCEICDKSFIQKITLKKHLRIHTGEKPFKCETCSQSFSLKTTLNDHLRIHTGEKPFKCETCSQSFSRKITLNDHLRIHTGEKPFKCEICNKCFSIKSSLYKHMQIHTGKKPFKCETCGQSFSRKKTLNDHLRIHTGENPFECEICNKCFNVKSSLYKHMQIHTGEKPFKCETCGQSFSRKKTLNDHLRIHTGEKPFKCEICNKCFNVKSNLYKHMQIHTGEKPFKCETCGQSFSRKTTLNDHLRTHTGEKPFKCEICNKYFNAKKNLYRHMHIHTGEKPFCCDTCGKCFIEKQRLKKHMNVHTGKKLFKWEK